MISRRVFLQAGAGLIPWRSSQSLTMQLDWRLNAQFAGLCVAQARGEYRRRGLRVTLRAAPPDMDVIETVVSQPQTVGCAEESLILDAQAKGVEVVAIAAMLQNSPLGLMSLPQSPISQLEQLSGKRVGVHSDGLKALQLVLQKQRFPSDQIDIIQIPYSNKYQRLLDGELDAVQCYALDEPLDFARRLGQAPTVLTFKDYGFEAYSQVIFAPSELLAANPQAIRQFLAATFAGWRWATRHPAKTAQLLVRKYVEPDYRDIEYQTQSLIRIADYVQAEPRPIGVIDPERWQRSAQQLAQAGLIQATPAMDASIDLHFWS